MYPITFDAEIAAGSTVEKSIKIDRGGFRLQAITGEAWITALLGSSVAGTPLPFESDPESGSNEMPSKAMLSIEFQTGSDKWMQGPVRWTETVGDARRPYYLPTPRDIPANQTVKVTITNNAAVAVRPTVTLHGVTI
jgi:hypothetical protein